MIATLGNQVSNARNYSGDKELVHSFKVVAFVNDEFREVVDVRCWMGRSRNASTVYAAIWVHSPNYYTSGKGSAGGYGYCKVSTAVGEAIASADIKLDKRIGGVGYSAIREALHAIASALGYESFTIVEA